MKRALIVCPGRGSYERTSLGYLRGRSEAVDVLASCDAWREERGQPTVSALDTAEAYQGRLHVAGEHASLLTFACSMADFRALDRDRYDVVGVVGNSMGWYTALAVADALSLADGVRLVDTMGAWQAGNVVGGQIIQPITDEQWVQDPAAIAAIDAALATAPGGRAFWSIRLGAYAVLGADEAGCRHLLDTLPKIERGSRTFPARLPLHCAFHTPLMAEMAQHGRAVLGDLAVRTPAVPLTDGHGRTWRPRWASPAGLWEWTLGAQVVEAYDFGLSLRAALRHCGPDIVIALGPGNSLGAPIASVLVAEGWGGVRSRADLDARQADDPAILSFGVTKQRERLTR